MRLIKMICTSALFFSFTLANAQDDLMKELDSVPKEKQVASSAFKALQVCNMQSTKMTSKNEWYFLVSHRFGDLKEGINNFFGLDNALTKLGGIYGVTEWLSLGLSRHTYNKTYEATIKYRFANQMEEGFPFTIVGYNTMDINSSDFDKAIYPNFKDSNRLAYSSQLIISRKFSDAISIEVNPVYIHKNLYDLQPGTEKIDQYILGFGGRCKVSKRISFNLEYAARLNPVENDVYHNPLTAGFDIETGGHVFQLVFSSSQPMNDVAYFTNTTGKWNGGSIYFGFNMYRAF
ncbi:DUF5777 family beta-barrel protein [Flavobacterium sp. RSB2_4_14]|uniref:DUF5777 family beta-barrel protein n=1 Tax=Flavobacterium sp. RSB2_4_14 TaxID=3447665 RepID=UPI003F3FCC95